MTEEDETRNEEGKEVNGMTTYIIMHNEEDSMHRSIDGIVPATAADPINWAQEWCQADANARAGQVLPLVSWKRFLSRGFGTAGHGGMRSAYYPETGTTYYVVAVSDLKMEDRTENTVITMMNR